MSVVLGAALLLQVVATAKPSSAAATARVDSTPSVADSSAVPDTASARVAFDFGTGLGTPVAARTFEFAVSGAPSQPAHARAPASATLRVVRTPDSLSAELARRTIDGGHIAEVSVRLPSRGGAAGETLVHLYDVQVVSSKLVSGDDEGALLERRLALDESIDQLTADLEEAQRQLGVTESLRKRDLSTSLELAHARSAVNLLSRRVAIQKQRLALVSLQLARWTPVQEESVLSAARVAIDGGPPLGAPLP